MSLTAGQDHSHIFTAAAARIFSTDTSGHANAPSVNRLEIPAGSITLANGWHAIASHRIAINCGFLIDPDHHVGRLNNRISFGARLKAELFRRLFSDN